MDVLLDPVERIAAEASVRPTMFDSAILGAEGSRQAWTYAKRAYLDNPLPLATRVTLLTACWEGRGRTSNRIHMTGLPLMGQRYELVNLQMTLETMVSKPGTRALLATTVRIGNGQTVPAHVQKQVRVTLGPWTRGWQDLCMFAGWADRLMSVHEVDVAPLEDERMEAWLSQLVNAAPLIEPYTAATASRLGMATPAG